MIEGSKCIRSASSSAKSAKTTAKNQKVEAVGKLKSQAASGEDTACFPLNGKPLNRRRLNRQVQRNRLKVTLSSVLSQSCCQSRQQDPPANPMVSDKTTTVGLAPWIPRVQLQRSTESYNDETILRSTETYYIWYETQSQNRKIFGFSSKMSKFFSMVTNGLIYLSSSNTQQGFAILNLACSFFLPMLQSQPLQILSNLVRLGRLSSLQRWPELKMALLNFMMAAVARTYSSEHPIFKFIAFLATTKPSKELTISLLSLEMDRAKAMLKDDVVTYFNYRIDHIKNHPDAGKFDAADIALEVLVRDTRSTFTPADRVYRRALKTCAWFQGRRGDYKSAIRIYHEILRCITEEPGKPNRSGEEVSICNVLALAYARKNQLEESKEHLQLATEGYLQLEQRYRRDKTKDILSCLACVENILRINGKRHKTSELRREYAHFWARLEPWKLDPQKAVFELE